MKAPKRASTVLRRAARIIRERGWCQGRSVDEQGHVCVVGALRVAYGITPDSDPVSDTLAQRVGSYFRMAVFNDPANDLMGAKVAAWNDKNGRTRGEVLRAFARAAKLAEKSERGL